VALHAHIIIRSEKSDDWKSVVSPPNEDAQLEQFVSMINGTAEAIGKLRPDVFGENLRKANEKFFNAKFFRGIENMLKTGGNNSYDWVDLFNSTTNYSIIHYMGSIHSVRMLTEYQIKIQKYQLHRFGNNLNSCIFKRS